MTNWSLDYMLFSIFLKILHVFQPIKDESDNDLLSIIVAVIEKIRNKFYNNILFLNSERTLQ